MLHQLSVAVDSGGLRQGVKKEKVVHNYIYFRLLTNELDHVNYLSLKVYCTVLLVDATHEVFIQYLTSAASCSLH